jgi:4-amino-4-deoxy-L-arabinose transferase-like glycosyltransferase
MQHKVTVYFFRTSFQSIFVFIVTLAAFLLPMIASNTINIPPEAGDAPDYDSIAFQLAHGQGFSYAWGNPEYLSPYLVDPNQYQYLLARTGNDLTTNRPPLYPIVLAIIYKIFGRLFYLVRILNAVALAISCVLGFNILSKRVSLFAGYIFTVLFNLNSLLHKYAVSILTECLAVLFVVLLVYFLIKLSDTQKFRYVVYSGLILSLCILNRSNFFPWILIVGLLVWVLLSKKGSRFSIFSAGGFIASAILLLIPWMVWNCVVTKSFMPLGVNGLISLPVAYSDHALKNGGVWYNPDQAGFYDAITSTGLQREVDKAKLGEKVGMEWIKSHLTSLPLLVMVKSANLWFPTSKEMYALYGLSLIGLFIYPNKSELLILLTILFSVTSSVAITWSVGSRFMVPVLPIFFLISSIVIYKFLFRCYAFLGRVPIRG